MAHNADDETSELILHADLDRWWDLPGEANISDYILRKVDKHFENGLEKCIENPITGEILRYSEIPDRSRRIASKFAKLGLGKGETVIYSTHDPIKLYVFMLGVWRANGIVRASYPEELGDALVRRITESKATFVACDQHFAQECLKAVKCIKDWPIKLIVFGGDAGEFSDESCLSINEFYNDDGLSLPESLCTLEDVALVLATSGTTGDSKGAIYTHKILLENIIMHEMMPYTDSGREPTIITSRQTHYVGSITAFSFLAKGRYLLMMSSVTVKSLLEAVDKYKVRAILAFPTYLTGMVAHPDRNSYDLSSLQYLTAAGQVIVPEAMALIRTLPNLKHFINLYGMTESGLLTSSADWAALKTDGSCLALTCRDYSVGRLPPGTSLKVLDMEKGTLLDPGCRGELCFKSPVTTKGYLARPKEEEETFIGGGWVKTGDIGYYSEDGFIFVVDRAKEVFKWNSNHVSPSEIENVLLRHPSVSQAAVIGVPCQEAGFIPRAFVVLKSMNNGSSCKLKDELVQFAQNNLPPYKHLKGGLYFLSELPLGKTGKVTRHLLAQLNV